MLTVPAVASRPVRIRIAGLFAFALIVLVLPGPLPVVGTAAAQEPYGPVVLDVSVRAGADDDRLALRLTGLRPNSSVEAVSDVGLRSNGLADGVGVVELDVVLPTSIDLEVRGIAADGTPLLLRETIALPRFSGNSNGDTNGRTNGRTNGGGVNGFARTDGSAISDGIPKDDVLVAAPVPAPSLVPAALPWGLAALGMGAAGVSSVRLRTMRRSLLSGVNAS